MLRRVTGLSLLFLLVGLASSHAQAQPALDVNPGEPAAGETKSTEPHADATLTQVRPVASVHALIGAGKLTAALKSVEMLIEHDPADDELKAVRARLLYWLGRTKEAEAQALALHQKHPTDLEVTELLAQIRLALADTSGALALYQELAAAGDRRPETQQRIVDLQLQLGDVSGARKSLKQGGTLSKEQELELAKIEHPWFADAGTTQTLHAGEVWPRLEGDIGYRFSPRLSVLVGAMAESRRSPPDQERAFAPKLEAYFAKGKLAGMVHLDGSPSRTFLPLLDARLDLAHQTTDVLGLGAYLRWAHYQGKNSDGTALAAVDAFSIAPNASFAVRSWVIQPGYMVVINNTGGTKASTSVNHTGFLKFRWQASAPTGVFLWTFLGQDPSFLERNISVDLRTSAAASVLLGVDHWWNGRLGTRASIARVQPLGGADPFTEFALVLRGRL